ncbi:MAG: hypothetical protein NZ840_11540 [Anaerolineales bacterium]|nr:hypothetical protein [Anaerolineales bacterium]MDW8162667.1 hypothetical protein [Anaerolineales bacterium]
MGRASPWVIGLCFLLALVYLATGVFPFAPMESDGNHIANGVTQMLSGEPPQNPFSYRYEAQSGTYWLLYWASRLWHLPPFDTFCILSAIGALTFVLTASLAVARVSNRPFALVGLGLLSLQEVWTSAYYPNSNILAAAFLFGGTLLAVLVPSSALLIPAGLLLGLSVWMRFDALLMLPVLPLLIHRGLWKETFWRSVWLGSIVALTILVTLNVSKVTLSEIFESSQSHFRMKAATTPGLGIPWLGDSNVKSHLAYFPLFFVVLLFWGFLCAVLTHRWRVVGGFLLGVLPLYLTYLGDLTTPKYLLYAAPFFVWLALEGAYSFSQHLGKWRFLVVLLGLLVLGQYVLGLRLRFVSKPYYYPAEPTFARLFRISLPFSSIDELSVVVGAGARISTVDRDRLFSGIFFAPLMWRTQKVHLNQVLDQLAQRIMQSPRNPVYLLVDEDDPLQQALVFLFRWGYRCDRTSSQEPYLYSCWGEDVPSIMLMDIRGNPRREANVLAENLAELNLDHWYFIVTAPWQEYLIDRYFSAHPQWRVEKLGFLVYEFESR